MASLLRATQKIESSGEKIPVNVEQIPAGQLWIQSETSAFLGTVAIEVSLDGTNFVASSASPLGNNEYKEIPELAKLVRLNVTVYTSGELDVTIAGHNPQ